MKITLQPNEKLIREIEANLQRGLETVGGKLFLTDQRLLFQLHTFNAQAGPTQIELSDVRGTQLCWTRFLGLIPLFPSSLAVQTASGTEYRFVISSREQWATAIEAQAQLVVA